MKVALISPKGPLYRHKGGIFKKNLRYAPLTLVHLAALVPEELNAELVIHDEGIEDIPTDMEVPCCIYLCNRASSVCFRLSLLHPQLGLASHQVQLKRCIALSDYQLCALLMVAN